MYRKACVLAIFIVALGVGSRVLAQHGGHGGDQGGMTGMPETTQGMQANTRAMMASDQMLRNIDSMMINLSSTVRDLNALHAGMPNHSPMMSSMQGTLDQMRQLHGSLTQMMRDPGFGYDAQGMRAFQQACRNLEQMTSSFQTMTKNLTQAIKGTSSGSKK